MSRKKPIILIGADEGITCPTCEGTGRQSVTKSIKDIIEEWEK